ncbi:FAD-dependent oxidoreductase [Virgibacillus xinjiangensis]|uniref:FAD-dependent oxidoreductase n=1 Tax=Virgibacillus xinjiangensis TaxID=393090 RepID=A0ABV7CVX7_9BACI
MNQKRDEKNLPDHSASYWRKDKISKIFPPLKENIKADTTIIGGGMTGILAAYMLAREGKNVVLLEGSSLLDGTTGFTTAKVTAQHDVMYSQLIEMHGEEQAGFYYDAQVEAMDEIRAIIDRHEIDCDFKYQDAILHAGTGQGKRMLKKEKHAYDMIGIKGELTDQTSLPFHTEKALIMKDQAHFHPVKFLEAIVKEVEKSGGRIYENTTALSTESSDEGMTVKTKGGYDVQCRHAIMATHFPFDDKKGFYFSRLHPNRSYTLAVKTEKNIPDGMYLGIDQPSFSMRHAEMGGEKIAIFGGEGHKTGKSIDTLQHFENIRRFVDNYYGIKEVLHRWSAQDLTPPDEVPYIGQAVTGQPGLLVATGYKKWGMTNSMAAATLLRDLILGKENRYKELFAPTRTHLKKETGKAILKELADDGAQMMKSHLKRREKHVDELKNGEGAIVSIKGKRTGAYRDEQGELHLIDPTCTHMNCGVDWNNGEKSWDCPCHGSRFSCTGEVIEGPAVEPLKKLNNQ